MSLKKHIQGTNVIRNSNLKFYQTVCKYATNQISQSLLGKLSKLVYIV